MNQVILEESILEVLFFLSANLVVCGSEDLISSSSSFALEGGTSGSCTSKDFFKGFFGTVSFDTTFPDQKGFPQSSPNFKASSGYWRTSLLIEYHLFFYNNTFSPAVRRLSAPVSVLLQEDVLDLNPSYFQQHIDIFYDALYCHPMTSFASLLHYFGIYPFHKYY